MHTPEAGGRHIQAGVIHERIIEYGLRRGLLDALRLSYQPEPDGSLLIHVPRHRGLFRIQPPGVCAATAIRVLALADEGRTQRGSSTLALRWDANTAEWALLDPGETGELAAEIWKAMMQLARDAGWLVPRAA